MHSVCHVKFSVNRLIIRLKWMWFFVFREWGKRKIKVGNKIKIGSKCKNQKCIFTKNNPQTL